MNEFGEHPPMQIEQSTSLYNQQTEQQLREQGVRDPNRRFVTIMGGLGLLNVLAACAAPTQERSPTTPTSLPLVETPKPSAEVSVAPTSKPIKEPTATAKPETTPADPTQEVLPVLPTVEADPNDPWKVYYSIGSVELAPLNGVGNEITITYQGLDVDSVRFTAQRYETAPRDTNPWKGEGDSIFINRGTNQAQLISILALHTFNNVSRNAAGQVTSKEAESFEQIRRDILEGRAEKDQDGNWRSSLTKAELEANGDKLKGVKCQIPNQDGQIQEVICLGAWRVGVESSTRYFDGINQVAEIRNTRDPKYVGDESNIFNYLDSYDGPNDFSQLYGQVIGQISCGFAASDEKFNHDRPETQQARWFLLYQTAESYEAYK